ncbi:MAG: hypothetical protein AAGK97_03665, partial [Bacteroidota bacterium]
VGVNFSDSTKFHIKGSHSFGLGLGFINGTQTTFKLFGLEENFSGNPSPAIHLQYEYGVTNLLGIGIYADYYRVDGEFNLPQNIDPLDDPLCYLQCVTGVNLTGCDCGNQQINTRRNVWTIAGRVAYHHPIIKDVDLYTSIIAGYSFNRRKKIEEVLLEEILKTANITNNIPTFIYKVNGGMRYFFSPEMAAYGEVGFSNTHIIRVGLNYRIL